MHYSLLHHQDGASEKPEGSPTSEIEAVVLARKGDGPAFALIFHRYNATLCSYLARLVGNDEIGRDLAQETFLRAWKSLPGLDGELQFKPWLYRIATNVARSHVRHELDQQEHSLLNVEGPEINAGEAEQIRHILAQLNPQSRICLLLQLSAGFSQREIAAVLKISEKSVSAYVSRGREQFRQLYRQMKGEAAR